MNRARILDKYNWGVHGNCTEITSDRKIGHMYLPIWHMSLVIIAVSSAADPELEEHSHGPASGLMYLAPVIQI